MGRASRISKMRECKICHPAGRLELCVFHAGAEGQRQGNIRTMVSASNVLCIYSNGADAGAGTHYGLTLCFLGKDGFRLFTGVAVFLCIPQDDGHEDEDDEYGSEHAVGSNDDDEADCVQATPPRPKRVKSLFTCVMCVCVCICMCVCTCVCVCVWEYVFTCMQICACKFSCSTIAGVYWWLLICLFDCSFATPVEVTDSHELHEGESKTIMGKEFEREREREREKCAKRSRERNVRNGEAEHRWRGKGEAYFELLCAWLSSTIAH